MEVRDLGLIDYEEAWELQRQAQSALISGGGSEIVFICEHPPVITIGKSGKQTNVLVPLEDLNKQGIKIHLVERGGDVTFHGPGQIVAYPIIDLRKRKQDVGWYMRLLEQAIIKTLAQFNLSAGQISGRTGVWVDHHSSVPRKIASLGVRISRWCTMHGLSLNVLGRNEDTHSMGQIGLHQGFSLIIPCGISGAVITTMEQELLFKPNLETVKSLLISELQI